MRTLFAPMLAALLALGATAASASSHYKPETLCFALERYRAALPADAPISLSAAETFCDAYADMVYDRTTHDTVFHTKDYLGQHRAAVAVLAAAEPFLPAGANLNVAFMLAPNSAPHEWMPGLYAVAMAATQMNEDLLNTDPVLANLVERIATNLAAIPQHGAYGKHMVIVNQFGSGVDDDTTYMDEDTTMADKESWWHYTHLHPLGTDTGELLVRLRTMAATDVEARFELLALLALADDPAIGLYFRP